MGKTFKRMWVKNAHRFCLIHENLRIYKNNLPLQQRIVRSGRFHTCKIYHFKEITSSCINNYHTRNAM